MFANGVKMNKSSPYADYQARLAQLLHLLNAEDIDLGLLKRHCFGGVPDEPGIRPLCWKLMLNYLPTKRASWHATLHSKRSFYYQCVTQMVLHPDEQRKTTVVSANGNENHQSGAGQFGPGVAAGDEVDDSQPVTLTSEDHPLSSNPQSTWSTYFRDNEVLAQIEKDARRLCPEMSFFQQYARDPLYFDNFTDRVVGHDSSVVPEPLIINDRRKSADKLPPSAGSSPVKSADRNTAPDVACDADACNSNGVGDNVRHRLVAEALRKRLNQGRLRSSAVRKTHTGGVTQLASSDDISLMFGENSSPHSAGIASSKDSVDPLNKSSESNMPTVPAFAARRARNQRSSSVDFPADGEYHWEVIMRMLFVHAKLNPGQSYVQGMNEIIGPIYYVLWNDCDDDARVNAEADAFFCFHQLMSEIRDNFSSHMDNVTGGVGFVMDQLMQLLQRLDMPVYKRLVEDQDLKPHFYAFRWLTLLLGQEYPLPDVIRIWDTLFADSKRFDFLLYVCCAMITMARQRILADDFAGNMKTLQNFYTFAEQNGYSVLQILAHAERLRSSLL